MQLYGHFWTRKMGQRWPDYVLGQKVKVQGHAIPAEAHSTRRYRRVQLFLVIFSSNFKFSIFWLQSLWAPFLLLTVWFYLYPNFCGGHWKKPYCETEWVMAVQGNQTLLISVPIEVHMQLPITKSSLGPISSHFRDIASFLLKQPLHLYSMWNLGMFPRDQITTLWLRGAKTTC